MKLLFLLLALPFSLSAQEMFMNVPNRATTSLNGKWNYIIDPYETGYLNFHAEVYDQKNAGSPSAYYNNYHAKNKSELVEYDFDKSPVMSIPGDWNTQNKELLYYEGTIWLKRSFNYSLHQPGNRVFLYFGAVNYKADVYLNGKKLGTHEGGFTPFSFEITSIVKPKDNYLVVKADNKRSKEAVPAMNTDWWNYGGITRDVLLVEEPPLFIKDYQVQLKKDDAGIITGYISLSQETEGEPITLNIPELNIKQELQTTATGTATFTIAPKQYGNIQYWRPETPKLYSVTIKTNNQSITDNIGFRTITTKGDEILLNGQPVFLRGICLHEEINGRRASSAADAATLLQRAKELGCNYVRLAHYPHNEHMLRMADKMGLMVWEEIPVYWTIDFKNEQTFANAKNQLTAMMARDKNRACTIIWSVANETPISEERNHFLRNLVQQAKMLDDTRLISGALLTRNENGVGIIDDPMGEYFDIISINQYRGWYGGDLATAPDAQWTTPYNKPLVISEFGGDALAGLHGKKEERWTEEYQEYLFRQNLLMIEKMPHIRGTSPWILTDFRSPRRVLPGIQDGFNRKGLYSNKGVKKKAFYIVQAFYKKMARIYR